MKFMIKTWNYIFCFLNATYFKLFLLIGKEGYHEINIKYKLYNKRNETKYIQIDIDTGGEELKIYSTNLVTQQN